MKHCRPSSVRRGGAGCSEERRTGKCKSVVHTEPPAEAVRRGAQFAVIAGNPAARRILRYKRPALCPVRGAPDPAARLCDAPARTGYSAMQIALHWIIAVLIIAQVVLHGGMEAT